MGLGGGGLYHPVESGIPFKIAVPKGDVPGVTYIHKFGRNGDVDQAVEDIWTGASGIPQLIWLPPTAARVHAIVSTDDTDGKTGSPTSVGARTLRVWGLTAWTAAETSEDITLDGTTGVNTSSSYVTLHRMRVLTSGATSINAGIITATAASDGTVTARIEIGKGQTEMAIYGIPSTQTLYLTQFYSSLGDGSGADQSMDVTFLINDTPDTEELQYRIASSIGMVEDGSSHFNHTFDPYMPITGPALMKIQCIASGNDNVVHAGFDGYLVTQ